MFAELFTFSNIESSSWDKEFKNWHSASHAHFRGYVAWALPVSPQINYVIKDSSLWQEKKKQIKENNPHINSKILAHCHELNSFWIKKKRNVETLRNWKTHATSINAKLVSQKDQKPLLISHFPTDCACGNKSRKVFL